MIFKLLKVIIGKNFAFVENKIVIENKQIDLRYIHPLFHKFNKKLGKSINCLIGKRDAIISFIIEIFK